MISRISREETGLDHCYPDLIIAISLCMRENAAGQSGAQPYSRLVGN